MSGPMPAKGVVFDLDGTLMDSLPLVLGALTHALEPFGARPTMEVFGQLGGPPGRFLAPMLRQVEDMPMALQRFKAYHEENAHRIQPYDGAAPLLHALQQEGVRLAVWTGRDRGSTDWLLRQHGLAPYFSAIVCGDDFPTHKPDPEGLRDILRQLGLGPIEAVMVGDADVDVLGAAACGVDAVLIRHEREIAATIAEKSWRMVASPVEAYEVVRGRVGAHGPRTNFA